ncbi:MAG: hypothetical protein IT219_12165 [Bacteroidales bacterium]|nr:hypothetical protein [Bacteroidales bacterium]
MHKNPIVILINKPERPGKDGFELLDEPTSSTGRLCSNDGRQPTQEFSSLALCIHANHPGRLKFVVYHLPFHPFTAV